jgi:hypothetical protein
MVNTDTGHVDDEPRRQPSKAARAPVRAPRRRPGRTAGEADHTVGSRTPATAPAGTVRPWGRLLQVSHLRTDSTHAADRHRARPSRVAISPVASYRSNIPP